MSGWMTAVALSAGYFGKMGAHPGLFAALETPVTTGEIAALTVGGRVGGYHQLQHHTGLFARAETTGRLTARSGPFAELSVGLGVHHRILAAPVYRRVDGELRRSVDAGRPGAMGGLGLGTGWDLSRRTDLPLRVFGRLDGWVRGPVNAQLLPDAAVSLGVTWTAF